MNRSILGKVMSAIIDAHVKSALILRSTGGEAVTTAVTRATVVFDLVTGEEKEEEAAYSLQALLFVRIVRRSGMPADCSESGPSASGRGLDRDAPTHTQCTTCNNADSAELYRPYGLGLM